MIDTTLLCLTLLISILGYFKMSQSYTNLSNAVVASVALVQQLKAQVTTLQTQVASLQAAQGTSDGDLDTLTNQLNTEVTAPVSNQ